MKPHLIVIRTPLLIVMAVALLACIRPTPQKELPTTFEETGHTDIRVVDTMESKYPQMAMPTHLGRILLNSEGDVIGVIFLTDRGDFLESKDGTHTCFIIRYQTTRKHPEGPLLKRFANNDEKITPIEISREKQWN